MENSEQKKTNENKIEAKKLTFADSCKWNSINNK